MNDSHKLNYNYEYIMDNIKKPDIKYAPYEFWFFDQSPDTLGLKPYEMVYQLTKKGFNPGYAHARVNYAVLSGGAGDEISPLTKDEWLSEKWFSVFENIVKQAKADGSHFCFTDEYGWPSLQAGGRILEQNPSMVSKSLCYEYIDLNAGEEYTIPPCFFAVSGKVVNTEKTSYIEYDNCKSGWENIITSFDMSPPEKNQTTPYNFAASSVSGGDGSKYAVFKPSLSKDGIYKIYSYWIDTGKNAENVPYEINGTLLTVNQNENFNQWNLIGEFYFPENNGCIKISNEVESDKKIVIDAIKLENENGDICIIDDLHTTIRNIAYLDSDSLHIIDTAVYKAPENGCYRLYIFRKEIQRGYDGGTINYLDKTLADKFIDIAYKPYENQLSQYLGGVMNGAFSDNEGDYGYKLAWSDDLEELFRQKTGKEMKQYLPLLIDRDAQGIDTVIRFQWFDTVSDIYSENFGKVSDYAEKMGMYYTMHTWDESIQLQVSCVGDLFKLNRRVSLPGTDALIHTSYNPQTMKDTFSIAEFDKKRCMNEVMALCGLHDYTPRELKKQANYLAVYGVSHVITHALKMTREKAQSIVTPDFYNIDPVWNCMNVYTDFVRRTSFINSNGYANAGVLLINPSDSMFALAEGDVFDQNYVMLDVDGGIPKINASFGGKAAEINRIYGETIRILTRKRIEHLTADKYYIKKMNVENSQLTYGDYKFSAVILPPMTAVDIDVAKKLLKFANSGGYIYYLGELPGASLQNGRNDSDIKSVISDMLKLNNVIHLCDWDKPYPFISSDISVISGKDNLLSHSRIIDSRHFIFVCNNNDTSNETILSLNGIKGKTQILCPVTGNITEANAFNDDTGVCVKLDFAPYESFYIIVDPSKDMEKSIVKVIYNEISLNNFTAEIDRGNVELSNTHTFPDVICSMVRIIVRKGAFDDPLNPDISDVIIRNRDTVIKAQKSGAVRKVEFENVSWLTYAFESQKINNITVSSQKGLTSYRIECLTDELWTTVTDFDTYSQSEVINPFPYPHGIHKVSLTDWSTWDFLPEKFAGAIDYCTYVTLPSTENIYLDLGKINGSAKVYLNGNYVDSKMFEPFLFDIGDFLVKGENCIRIRVSNTISSNIWGVKGGLTQAKIVFMKDEDYI